MSAAEREESQSPGPLGPFGAFAAGTAAFEQTDDTGAPDPVRSPHPPLLLQGQDYAFRAARDCLDFQERVHHAGMVGESGEDPQPCVLVLARAADMEMNDLSLALAEHDIRMVRLDSDRCLDLAMTVYTDAPLVEFERWLLRPVLVWRRHFDLNAVPVDESTVQGSYVREQWYAVARWLSSRPDWNHVNTRTSDHLDRLTQLADAGSFGLRVPRTAVTTRPGRTRPGGAECVVKTAGRHFLEPRPGALRGLFPRPLDTNRAPEAQESAPVIVQRYERAQWELRAFVVGDRMIGYRVDKLDPEQLWVDPEAVSVVPTEVPAELGQRLLALAQYWGLQVAAFDLLVAADTPSADRVVDFVFLEVNASCDWRWFEQRAGDQQVSDAVTAWVVECFRQATT